jgi:hypothetical protein
MLAHCYNEARSTGLTLTSVILNALACYFNSIDPLKKRKEKTDDE